VHSDVRPPVYPRGASELWWRSSTRRRLRRLPANHQVVSSEVRPPIVRGPSGQLLRITPNGRLESLVERVRSYLHVEEQRSQCAVTIDSLLSAHEPLQRTASRGGSPVPWTSRRRPHAPSRLGPIGFRPPQRTGGFSINGFDETAPNRLAHRSPDAASSG
jgi:hypothetical protein